MFNSFLSRTIRNSNPGSGKRCFSSSKFHTGPATHPASYSMGTGGFPGLKRPDREVHHSCPFSAVVKNEWSCTSTPAICLHGVTETTFCLFPLNCYLFYLAEHQLSAGQKLKLLLQIFKGCSCKV